MLMLFKVLSMSKSGLIGLAILLGLLGGGGAFASGRTMCILNECILAIEGKGLGARGIQIDSGTAQVVRSSPFVLFSLAGACLLGGLLKTSDRKQES